MVYVKLSEASKQLGLHANTLRKYADDGTIPSYKTPSGQRRFDVEAYLRSESLSNEYIQICYCRVSSYKQKDDLERQIAFMQKSYPKAQIVKDIGSGINFKRKGLRSILERVLRGDKLEVVVAHRDRLARFGFELVEFLVEQNGGKVVVLSRSSTHSPEEELTKDLLTILHVFSCRMHGLRKYRSKIAQDKNLSNV